MNFIKKIVDGKIDNLVHLQFQKFSRGQFKNKAILKVKKTKNKYTINTSPEFANEFVGMMAKKLGNNPAKVTGAIVSTSDLKEKLEYVNIKQFQGVKRYLIEKEMTGDELISLLEEFPKTFFGLTFDVDETNKLKIKAFAPSPMDTFSLLDTSALPIQRESKLPDNIQAQLKDAISELISERESIEFVISRMVSASRKDDISKKDAIRLTNAIQRLRSDIEFLSIKWGGDSD